MKKLLIILSIIGVAFLTSAVFTSCSKEPDSLTGTTWKGRLEVEGHQDITLSFTSDVSVRLTALIYNDDGSFDDTEDYTCTYTYSKPTVVVKDDGYEMLVGTVSGNTMTVDWGEGLTNTLTKQ